MVPIHLRPTSIRALFERFTNVPDLFAAYWPTRSNDKPGVHIDYEILTHSRRRMIQTDRAGPPIYTDPDPLTIVAQQGETWREGKRIGAETIRDVRMPGSSTEARGMWEATRRAEELRRSWQYTRNYLRAEGLQGVKNYRPPSAYDLHYDELLLCATTCLIPAPVAPWNAAAATALAAATNLANIRTDFMNALVATTAAGVPCDTVIMNYITLGYIETQAYIAGTGGAFEFLLQQIWNTGHIQSAFGMKIDLRDETYVHPISGATVFYIPTNVAIFTSTDNAAIGRELVECEAVHINAPPGTYGLYIDSYEWLEAPGEVRISGEWTAAPVIATDCGQYVIQDVTALR